MPNIHKIKIFPGDAVTIEEDINQWMEENKDAKIENIVFIPKFICSYGYIVYREK